MKILALDTSNRPLSVAVLEDDTLLAETTLNMARKHSTTLMPIISEMLQKSDTTPQDLDRIVVSAGPGSYTGLRIGVTAAKTLAFTLNKELVGVSSLELLAANCQNDTAELLVPIFDARRENLSVVELCEFLKDKKVCLIGDAKVYRERFEELLTADNYRFSAPKDDYPSAYLLGLLGKDRPVADTLTFVPHYLRLTQAEVQWMEKHPGKDQADSYVEKV